MSIGSLTRFVLRIARSNFQEIPLPYRLTYAVTFQCQARCAMCNIWQKHAVNELSLDEIATIFGTTDHISWINLTGGELFQRADMREVITEIIRRSKNLHLLNFPTNGILTDEIVKTVDTVLRKTSLPRLIVSVSIDGPSQLHDEIRGYPGAWDHAMETFLQLRARSSSRFSVYIGHTIQRKNIGKIRETFDACRTCVKGLSLSEFHLNIAHFSGHYYDNADRDALPDARETTLILAGMDAAPPRPADPVWLIEQRFRSLASAYLKTGRSPLPCQAASASCYIDPEGVVYPCTGFDHPIGSLREHGLNLRTLWQTAARRECRSAVTKGLCPGCWTPCEAYQTILAHLATLPRVRRP